MVIRHEPRSVMGRDYTHVRGHLLQDFLTLGCIFLLAQLRLISDHTHSHILSSHSQQPGSWLGPLLVVPRKTV